MAKRHPSSRRTVSAASPPAFWASTRRACHRLRRSSPSPSGSLAKGRRPPGWALGAGALLTVVSLAARALILPALAWGLPDGPPFGQMFFGALALLHAPLIVPLPSGGGGLEVAFLNGFAGYFGAR